MYRSPPCRRVVFGRGEVDEQGVVLGDAGVDLDAELAPPLRDELSDRGELDPDDGQVIRKLIGLPSLSSRLPEASLT